MTDPVKAAPPAPKPTGLALLRASFPDNQIGKKPQPTAKKEVMDQIKKGACSICHGYHEIERVIHLDYIGHAAVTDRLLDADPNWFWEPMAFGLDGLPVFDKKGGLWIWLTVAGVRRIGYGSAEAKSWSAPGSFEKEIIGDALRNAAMRFGVGLELWHKGELHKTDPSTPPPQSEDEWPPVDGGDESTPVPRKTPTRKSASQPAAKSATKPPVRSGEFVLPNQVKYLLQFVKSLKLTDIQLQALLTRHKIDGLDADAKVTLEQFNALKAELEQVRDA